jgi:putative hydrolase of the HAD superfamily
MTQGVFVDLVGTLVRAAQPIGDMYADWARRYGATEADPAQMGDAFRRAMRAAAPMVFPGLKDLRAIARAERSWWRDLVREVIGECDLGAALGGERFEAFFAGLYDHFTTSNAWVAYPDARPTLERLRRAGVVVGLITNYDTRVYSVLDALGLSALLDSVTIPALAGAAKPDQAIFEHALRHHGLDARSAVYVGDEVGDDYEGAQAAGMRAILIDREGRNRGMGMRRIASLTELTVESSSPCSRIRTPRRTP